MSQATENGKRPASTSTRTRRPKAAAPTGPVVETVVQSPDLAPTSIETASAPVAPVETELESVEAIEAPDLKAVEAVAVVETTQPEAAAEDESAEVSTAIKLRVDCRELLRAVEKAATAVAGSKSNPSLQSLMIQADQVGQTLTVTGYNFKVCLLAVVQAQVEQGGEFLIPATCLTGLLGQMPEDTYLTLDSASAPGLLHLSCAGIQYQERVQPTTSYPELPVLDERIPSSQQYSLNAAELGTGLSAVLFAADRDDSKPTNAVLLQLWRGDGNGCEDSFSVISASSGCAALYTVNEKWHNLTEPDPQFLLPIDAVPGIKKMCFAAGSVACCFDAEGKLLQFTAEVAQSDDSTMPVSAMIRLREWTGAYPPVRQALPNLTLDIVKAEVDYRQLVEAISRQEAARSKMLLLGVEFDQVTLLTVGGERERQVKEQISADTRRSGSILLPIQQLIQALKAVECEQIALCLDSQLAKQLLIEDGQEHRLTVQFIDRPLQVMMMRIRGTGADTGTGSKTVQQKSGAGKARAKSGRGR